MLRKTLNRNTEHSKRANWKGSVSVWLANGSLPCTTSRNKNASENDRSTAESDHGRDLTNSRQYRSEYGRSDGLAERGEIHDVGRQIFQSPVHPRVTEEHRTDG